MVIDSSEVQVVDRPCVVGLPLDAYVEYFGVLSSGKTFVICRPRDKWDYKDFALIVDGKSVSIKNVTRYRDGGTTDVESVIGNFHFPSPFEPQEIPTFNDQGIVLYGQDDRSKSLR